MDWNRKTENVRGFGESTGEAIERFEREFNRVGGEVTKMHRPLTSEKVQVDTLEIGSRTRRKS